MSQAFSRFLRDETGATSIEYGLIATLISVAIIAAFTNLGSNVGSTWNKVANVMP